MKLLTKRSGSWVKLSRMNFVVVIVGYPMMNTGISDTVAGMNCKYALIQIPLLKLLSMQRQKFSLPINTPCGLPIVMLLEKASANALKHV